MSDRELLSILLSLLGGGCALGFYLVRDIVRARKKQRRAAPAPPEW